MAYTAWSVVFGEQPTAAKWNQLGQNDAGFKDGTNFDADIIKSKHIDWAATGGGDSGGIWWEELGRATLASPATTLATGTFAARKYLMILVIARPSGAAITPWFRLNADSGNNYALRYSANYAAGTGLGSQNGMSFNPSSINSAVWGQIMIENEAATEKHIYINAHDLNTAGAANVPNIIQSNGKWANTSSQVTAFSIFNSGSANNFGTGTEIVVLGHN